MFFFGGQENRCFLATLISQTFLKIFFTVAGASQLQDIYFQCQPEWEII
jgi:hypothetical protein